MQKPNVFSRASAGSDTADVQSLVLYVFETTGCGWILAYVDAKLVNADGSPKVGPGGFTEVQAQKLKAAKVRLRGIPDLEQRAKALEQDIRAAGKDGLTPKARQD